LWRSASRSGSASPGSCIRKRCPARCRKASPNEPDSRRQRQRRAARLLARRRVRGLPQHRLPGSRDPWPAWTACYGETKGIKHGDTFTKKQCDEKLLARLDEFGNAIERCVPALKTAPRKVYVASLSLAYNIGEHAFCRSSVARLHNEGSTIEACDAMLKFDKANGLTFPGLTRRREKERVLCIEGYMEGRLGMAWRV
jgi:lysozyme